MLDYKELRIAFVKQEVYSDLYVCKSKTPPLELLFSSLGRVGPFGLFTHLETDFLIVKEDNAKECQVWQWGLSEKEIENLRLLKTKKLNEIPGNEFKEPGVDVCQGDLAVSVDEVDWNKYNIVISMNISIPTRIIEKYPKVLWAHMSAEGGAFLDKAYYGYDITLVQMTRGEYEDRVLEFPYTFIGMDDLEKEMMKLELGGYEKKGIFGEVNCVTERPVKSIPQFESIARETGEPVKYHKQKIKNNLLEMLSSKYFLKIGGRGIRGNGVIEAISCGTPVLMSPDDITNKQILPPEAWVFSQKDAIEKINYYNNNEDAWHSLLKKERELVQMFAFEYPLYNLIKAYNEKTGPNKIIDYLSLEQRVIKKIARCMNL